MSSTRFAPPLEPPYYAVVFASQRAPGGEPDYGAMSTRMLELAAAQDGFLGVESARDASGFGITVSYWRDEELIARWKADSEHRLAQARGRRDFYERFEIRVARVERGRGFAGGLR